jgi:predicted alpha/beta hydrolase family esterase
MSRPLRALLVLVACLAFHGQAGAQDRPLVFVHGFKSDGTTWNETTSRLRVQLAITATQPWLAWRAPFTDQAAELESKIHRGTASPFAIAHSNGGPVIREWSKVRPLSGLLTLSSPNQGAPIANNAGAFAMYNANIVTSLLNVNAAFSDPNDPQFWIRQVIQGAMAFAGDTVSVALAALGTAGFDLAAPVFEHERVGSPFMAQLNSGAWRSRHRSPTTISGASSAPRTRRPRITGGWRCTRPSVRSTPGRRTSRRRAIRATSSAPSGC